MCGEITKKNGLSIMEFYEEGESSQNGKALRTDSEMEYREDMNEEEGFSEMQEEQSGYPQQEELEAQEEQDGQQQQEQQEEQEGQIEQQAQQGQQEEEQQEQYEQEEQGSAEIKSHNEQESAAGSSEPKSAEIPITLLKQKLQIVDETQSFESNAEPSKEEIQQCLMNMQAIFHKGQVTSVIENLHRILHVDCIYNKFKTHRNKVNMLETIDISGHGRQPDQVKVASSFVNYGYGLKILRQTINDPKMTPNRYNIIITAVVRITFRKLEQLMTVFGKQIKPVVRMQERKLRSPLINGDKWLPADELETFKRLVKSAYQIEKVLITPHAAQKLYNSIMKQLKQRENLQSANKYKMNPKPIETGKKEASRKQ